MSLTFDLPKDPRDIAPYSFDWTSRVHGEATITSHTVRVVKGDDGPVVDPDSDLTVVTSQVLEGFVIAVLSGGTIGRDYRVESEITLSTGERFNCESKLRVRNR